MSINLDLGSDSRPVIVVVNIIIQSIHMWDLSRDKQKGMMYDWIMGGCLP